MNDHLFLFHLFIIQYRKNHKAYNNTHIVLKFNLRTSDIIQFISKAFVEK